MSGGSMNYLYSKLEWGANFDTNTPERKAFMAHLVKVAKALHDIEWVDSGDYVPGDENDAIRACIGDGAAPSAQLEVMRQALDALQQAAHIAYSDSLVAEFNSAIDALRAALGDADAA
jgi:hypothetical protein